MSIQEWIFCYSMIKVYFQLYHAHRQLIGINLIRCKLWNHAYFNLEHSDQIVCKYLLVSDGDLKGTIALAVWVRPVLQTFYVTSLHKIGQHHNGGTLFLPDQPPEINDSVLEGGWGVGRAWQSFTPWVYIYKNVQFLSLHAVYITCYQESIEVMYMHISSLPCHSTVDWFGMRNIIMLHQFVYAAPVFMYLYSCPDRWHHCLPCVAMNLRGRE